MLMRQKERTGMEKKVLIAEGDEEQLSMKECMYCKCVCVCV